MYLEVNLKIFRIDDGEEYLIVSKDKEGAVNLFLKEFNFENLDVMDLDVREIQNDEDFQINLSGDDDLLIKLINRYRATGERIETINIWNLLKYSIIEKELQEKEFEVPYVISSSIFC